MSDVSLKLNLIGDSKSIEKSLDRASKDLERTSKQAKQTKKDVSGLGSAFTQTANNVAIFNGQLDPISGRLSSIGTGLTRFGVGGVAAAAGLSAVTLSVFKAIDAHDQYEKRQLRFNALLSATSYQSGQTARSLNDLADQIGNDTLSNTEEAAEGINALLTFKKVQGDVFTETIKLARDAQVVYGGSLRETATAFGKALNDPIANLGALSRKGIQFSDVQKDLIHDMWEMGDAAGAQNIILEEMRTQFGGLAEKEAQTLEGKLDSLGHAWDRMWERAGNTPKMQQVTSWYETTIESLTEMTNNVAHNISDEKVLLDLMHERVEVNAKLARAESAAKRTGNDSEVTRLKLRLKLITDQQNVILDANQAIIDEESEQAKIGSEARLAAEKETNQKLYDEAVKNSAKVSLAVNSRFEDPKDKITRQFDEAIVKLEKAQKREIFAATKNGNDLAEINERFAADRIAAATGRDAKLQIIDDRAAAREKAETLRAERAVKVQANADAKRAKFLNSIGQGDDEVSRLTQDFGEDLLTLQKFEDDKSQLSGLSEQERFELFQSYREKLALTYQKDVENFTLSEEAKTLKLQEQSAKRAGEQFKTAASEGASNVDDNQSAVGSFFGVNFDEINKKNQSLLAIQRQHIAASNQLAIDGKITEQEALARIDAIEKEGSIQQAELKREGRENAEAATWDAVNTLAETGSKKAFAISKAMNIAQVTIKTIDAAMGAYSSLSSIPLVGPALGAAAAAAIGAAGLVNVNKIKNQQMPQFHDGIDYVPREGTYLLNQGERVVDSRLNADLKEDLKRRNQGGNDTNQGVNITLTIPDTGNYQAMERWYEDNSDRIVAHLGYALNRP